MSACSLKSCQKCGLEICGIHELIRGLWKCNLYTAIELPHTHVMKGPSGPLIFWHRFEDLLLYYVLSPLNVSYTVACYEPMLHCPALLRVGVRTVSTISPEWGHGCRKKRRSKCNFVSLICCYNRRIPISQGMAYSGVIHKKCKQRYICFIFTSYILILIVKQKRSNYPIE